MDAIVMWVALLANVIVHECAHLIAVVSTGGWVREVVIGTGPSVRVGRLKLGCIPISGHVMFRNDSLSAGQRVFVYLSGPVATAVLLCIYLDARQPFRSLVVAQLISALALSLLPVKGSDYSNAIGRME